MYRYSPIYYTVLKPRATLKSIGIDEEELAIRRLYSLVPKLKQFDKFERSSKLITVINYIKLLQKMLERNDPGIAIDHELMRLTSRAGDLIYEEDIDDFFDEAVSFFFTFMLIMEIKKYHWFPIFTLIGTIRTD